MILNRNILIWQKREFPLKGNSTDYMALQKVLWMLLSVLSKYNSVLFGNCPEILENSLKNSMFKDYLDNESIR